MKFGLASFLALLLGACTSSSPEVWHPADSSGAGAAGVVAGAAPIPWGFGGGPPLAAGSGGGSSEVAGDDVEAALCETTRDGIWIECRKLDSICSTDECLVEGACLASGATSADGCCVCEAGVSRCLNSPACPSTQLTGKRCRDQRDCSFPGTTSDMECRSHYLPALQADLNVCARPCAPLCPAGMECLHIPNEDGELTAEPVCMRLCETQADCTIEVGGSSLASHCIGFGLYMSPLVRSYCF